MEFPGFPKKALMFLTDIKQNNNREWFNRHKADFVEYIQQPAQDFAIALGTSLQKVAPGMRFDPSLRGSGSVMRIYRDIRFSKDKSPYKTYLGIRFWEGASRKTSRSGAFVWIDADGAGLHVGNYSFSKQYLEDFRKAVDRDQTGQALEQVLETVGKHAKIGKDSYARVPRGFAADHPRAELLRVKGLYATMPGIAPEVVTSPDFLPTCVEGFRKLAPLHFWLAAVG